MAAESPPRVVADRYEVGEVIGHGGMGEIRRAVDTRLGREVAIKFLRPDLAVQPEVRRRFEHEARAAAQLAHPNVVTVYDSGEADGQPYIVMECLPGRTLADEIATGPLLPARVGEIAAGILGALAAAHAEGIVHRDVKPGNLLVAADGQVKVSDFGIAKSTEVLDPTLTGQILGTPAYVAPERLDGHTATVRSDLYSVGVVLYEALAGRRPFHGDTPMAMARSVLHDAPASLREVCPDATPALTAAIERAMAKDPAQRFADAAQMEAALGAAPPIGAHDPTGVIDATDLMSVPVHGDPTTEVLGAAATRVERTAPWLSGPIIAIIVGVITVVAVLIARNADDPSTDPPAATTTPTVVQVPADSQLPRPLDDAIDLLEELVRP